MNIITYEQLLKEKWNYTLIDVRSPKEFEEEPIPGAINIPLLLNDERVEVGTAYKQVSPEKAKEIGVEALAKRLPDLFREVQKHTKSGKLVFFCARGGMRSGSMAALFSALGYSTYKIDGGYRAYRNFILEEIPKLNENIKYYVLHGKTGIGKTKVLQRLEADGYSVLDLEKMADHKGSFFGGVCEARPQSQKRFETLIFEYLYKNRPEYVIAESESKRIGNVYVPESIYNSLVSARHLSLEATLDLRADIIMEDYAAASLDELQACLDKVGRYITPEKLEEYTKLLEEKDLRTLSKILMVEYYDPLYMKSITKYEYDIDIEYDEIEKAKDAVEKYLNEREIYGEREKI